MNEAQRKIFSKILDVNSQLEDLKEELKKSMGLVEYHKFMSMGAKMFGS